MDERANTLGVFDILMPSVRALEVPGCAAIINEARRTGMQVRGCAGGGWLAAWRHCARRTRARSQ